MTDFASVVASAKLTPEQRTIVLDAIRAGLSLTGAARLCGRSRSWLIAVRKGHPDFEEDVQKALGELERDLCAAIADAGRRGEAAEMNAFIKLRSNRFPQLHGDDPRLRYSIETAGEEHPDDNGARVQEEGLPAEVRDRLLAAYYAEQAKP